MGQRKVLQREKVMSDKSDHIKAAIKELDLCAEDLEKAGAPEEIISSIDKMAERLGSYYSMEYPMMGYPPMEEEIDEEIVEEAPAMGYQGEDVPMMDYDQPMMNYEADMPEAGCGSSSMPSMEEMDYSMDDDDDLYGDDDDEDDLYGDDVVEEYDADMMYAQVVASVAESLEKDNENELAAEVRALLAE
jgi:hypothetical protein